MTIKEYWEITLDKARENVIVANLLFERDLYGLSAYHAQQTLELSIKAIAYRLGFLKYINKTLPLKVHNPSKLILPFVFDFLIDEIEVSDKLKTNPELKIGLNEAMKIFISLRKTLYDSRDNHSLSENIWKASLKIPIHDEKIGNLKTVLESYADSRLPIFLENSMDFVQETLHETFHELRKMRHEEIIYFLIKETEKTFAEHGLPVTLVKSMIDRKSDQWKNELKQFIQKTGEFETLDLILGPNGVLSSLRNSSLKTNMDGKWNTDDRLKIAWMTYVSTISPLALLIYPHEEYGRYHIVRVDFDTEELYKQNKMELQNILKQSESIYRRIEKMLLVKK